MRKLLLVCLTAAFASALFAQNPTRPTARPTVVSKPSTSATDAKTKTGVAPESVGKTTLQPNGTAKATTRTETTAGNQRSTTTTAKAVSTATKTVPAQMPATPPQSQKEPMMQVQWMSLEEALEKSKSEKRKIFIDVFTDWCGWCKRMDQSTFVDPEVAKYLNDNYYPVKFNAEQQADVDFNNKTYHFRKNGARGYHELAAEWLNNRLSFPTVVFLDETMNVIQPIPGYLEATKMETILNYFGSDSHKTTPWETYEKKFTNNQQR